MTSAMAPPKNVENIDNIKNRSIPIKLIIAAIIWLSVKVDENTPNEIRQAPKRKKLKYVPAIWRVKLPLKIMMVSGKSMVKSAIITNTRYAARNLPITILGTLVGEVKSSTSVPFFLSSAYILIVIMDENIINMKPKKPFPKIISRLDCPDAMFER
jgi:hypothetical protein